MYYIEQRLDLNPTGENADKLLQFKRWFWSIVEKMSMTERQDLVSLFFIVIIDRKPRLSPFWCLLWSVNVAQH